MHSRGNYKGRARQAGGQSPLGSSRQPLPAPAWLINPSRGDRETHKLKVGGWWQKGTSQAGDPLGRRGGGRRLRLLGKGLLATLLARRPPEPARGAKGTAGARNPAPFSRRTGEALRSGEKEAETSHAKTWLQLALPDRRWKQLGSSPLVNRTSLVLESHRLYDRGEICTRSSSLLLFLLPPQLNSKKGELTGLNRLDANRGAFFTWLFRLVAAEGSDQSLAGLTVFRIEFPETRSPGEQ